MGILLKRFALFMLLLTYVLTPTSVISRDTKAVQWQVGVVVTISLIHACASVTTQTMNVTESITFVRKYLTNVTYKENGSE